MAEELTVAERFLIAETHRLIAEDYTFEMPVATRMRLFDLAQTIERQG